MKPKKPEPKPEARIAELEAALLDIAAECGKQPITNGLAVLCESIARVALAKP